MDRIIIEQLDELILLGEFEAAKKSFVSLPKKEQSNYLLDLAYDSESISTYTFLIKLLLDQESFYWHYIATEIFMVSLCYLNGADAVGIFHIKRAIELNSSDINLKSLYLTYFNGNPEPFLTYEEAIKIAKEILRLDANNADALDALNKCDTGKIKNIVIDKNDFSSLLYYGKFEEARELVKDLTADQLFEVLWQINQKEQTITVYGYVVSLLLDNETAALHHLASRVLIELLNSIKGADVSAYWHAKRAVELDPENAEYKQWLHRLDVL